MSLHIQQRFRCGFGGGLWLVAFVASSLPASSAAPRFAFVRRLVRGAPHCGSPHPSGSALASAKDPRLDFSALTRDRIFFTAAPETTFSNSAQQLPM